MYFSISFISCLVDLFSKQAINKRIKEGETKKILGNKVYFINTKNYGFAYNKLGNKPNIVKGVTVFMALVAGGLFIKIIEKGNIPSKIFCSLAIGGAMGNLIDRLKNNCVTDFIFIKSKRINTPVFNLADVFIVIGSFVTAILYTDK